MKAFPTQRIYLGCDIPELPSYGRLQLIDSLWRHDEADARQLSLQPPAQTICGIPYRVDDTLPPGTLRIIGRHNAVEVTP